MLAAQGWFVNRRLPAPGVRPLMSYPPGQVVHAPPLQGGFTTNGINPAFTLKRSGGGEQVHLPFAVVRGGWHEREDRAGGQRRVVLDGIEDVGVFGEVGQSATERMQILRPTEER